MSAFRILIMILTSLGWLGMPAQTEIAFTDPPKKAGLFALGTVSTSMNERDLAISPAGDELMYSFASYDNRVRAIVVLHKTGEQWSRPEVASFSGQFDDIEPFYAPSGKQIFFASNRPSSSQDSTSDFNIWYCDRSGNGWSEPTLVPEPVYSEGNEYYPSVAANGNLYFTAARDDSKGTEDIYMSAFKNGAYSAPVSLDTAVNSQTYEYNAFVSPDESLLVFGSYGRPDDHGGGDLYISTRGSDGKWQPARNLGHEINSTALDYCPFVDLSNGVFYFSSNRSDERPDKRMTFTEILEYARSAKNGSGNIYWISWEVIKETLNRPPHE